MGGVLRSGGPAVGPVLIAFAYVPLFGYIYCIVLTIGSCIWTIGFNLSCGPMGYVYVAETATTRLRAKTTGVAIVFIQGMATVYVYIAPHMLNSPALGMSNTGIYTIYSMMHSDIY